MCRALYSASLALFLVLLDPSRDGDLKKELWNKRRADEHTTSSHDARSPRLQFEVHQDWNKSIDSTRNINTKIYHILVEAPCTTCPRPLPLRPITCQISPRDSMAMSLEICE